ncbi:sigma-54 interaction domain-containing protein [Aneurinibacillus danicus]|uniref:Arginine utilization regulatory protein RocR n=1 Tax=Aneurinibacillus danicus TaxID=267746 RepID=A0A511VAD2_9BACL|nr:sigma 54-interacting transcriptional regulator [Aneurinibacillus danicus]GEN35890.1 arginine utilization regulatory protein RocR [Aneurinibacillus danicus]
MSKLAAIWSEEFEWLLGIINVGIHLVDREGTTVFFNETMAEIDGLDRKDVIGQSVFDLFPSLTNESSTLIRVLSTGEEIVDKVQTYMNMKGKQITSINSTYPLRKGGEIIGAVELAEDITRIVQLNDQVLDLRQQLYKKTKEKKNTQNDTQYHFSDLIGESPLFQQALTRAKRAARTHSPVLICGPTGTGKELIAQSIHNASIRRDKPFIAQNCAAVPRELMEGLLFGTTKGAFTGAIDRPGIFEQANGGTLFLDEINSLDIMLQAKLLRVLQEGRVRRVGGAVEQEVNVRILAAMNIGPHEALKNNILRSDLFFRLNVVNIELPPLRRRKEDIVLLTKHFIEKFNQTFAMKVTGVSREVMNVFLRYPWPGNIRELRHSLESAFNMLEENEEKIELRHLPLQFTDPPAEFGFSTPAQSVDSPLPSYPLDLPAYIESIERDIIEGALKLHQGNVSKTADALGVKRQALQYKLKKFNL